MYSEYFSIEGTRARMRNQKKKKILKGNCSAPFWALWNRMYCVLAFIVFCQFVFEIFPWFWINWTNSKLQMIQKCVLWREPIRFFFFLCFLSFSAFCCHCLVWPLRSSERIRMSRHCRTLSLFLQRIVIVWLHYLQLRDNCRSHCFRYSLFFEKWDVVHRVLT